MADDIFPPAFDTAVGQVRSLIPDVEQLEDPTDLAAPEAYIFSDALIQSYLVLSRDNVFRAAAIACNTLATSEALILKVLKSDDRQTDGAKLADAIGRRADWLLKEAVEEDAEVSGLYEGFDIITPHFHPHTWEIR